jgi:hypothetical protein
MTDMNSILKFVISILASFAAGGYAGFCDQMKNSFGILFFESDVNQLSMPNGPIYLP